MTSHALLPLLRALDRPPTYDVTHLAALAAGLPPADSSSTCYAEIRAVPPGTEAAITERGASLAQLDVPAFPSLDGMSDDQLATRLRNELGQAIERALSGARAPGVMLSGGVDSSSVLALCSLAARRRTRAFGIHFASRGDDRPYFELMCRASKVQAERVSPKEAAPWIRASLVLAGAPTAWPSAALEYALFTRARETGTDVLLSGMGGDDVFDGELSAMASYAGEAGLARAAGVLLGLRGAGLPSPLSRLRTYLLLPRLKPWVPDGALRLRRLRAAGRALPWMPRARVRALLSRFAVRPDAATPEQKFLFLTESAQYTHVARLRAQFEQATGVMRRDPFLDVELLRFVSAIPNDRLLHGGWVRGLFRSAMRGLLPDEVRLRQTKAFFEPAFAEMLASRGGLGALEDLWDVRQLASLGLADPEAFRDAVLAVDRAPEEGGWLGIWPALSVEAFLRSQAEAVPS